MSNYTFKLGRKIPTDDEQIVKETDNDFNNYSI